MVNVNVNVSVIIPAYNGDRYIEGAIASVLAQTYSDYELIIVDDGSTDETAQVIKSYGDRINYIYQPNQGVAQARNTGLAAAQGKYIAFLDQDDFFYPEKLASQMQLMEQKPNLGMIGSGWEIVNSQGAAIDIVRPWDENRELNIKDIIIWKPVFLGAMLFSHAWLKQTHGFDPRLEQTPDVDLVLRLAAIACPAYWLKDITVGYRQHERNASGNTLLQAEELNSMLERFFSDRNLQPQVKALEPSSRYQSLVWSSWRLYSTGNITAMADYLAKSCNFSNKPPTQTVMHWIKSFKSLSEQYGETIDIAGLCQSPEWQNLIKNYVF
ncbi:glycosyl transferase [Xenococcus sp. PCC 7305]|uniref:glycosyltransferase family 2 protein n=1 Tax=Xenococcus sp. PCC 7305 TaxID=102125 RepID=UPI0002AC8D2A|nr:glycosyltransferase family A protein [Xenococcus sp. PCC 7305]ELS00867.1 glycosyl transferase [Xenococcus sp. PCC 7305]